MFSHMSFALRAVLKFWAAMLFLMVLIVSGCSDEETDPVSSVTALPDLVVTPQTVVLSGMQGSEYRERVHVRVDADPYGNVGFRFSCESSWMSVSNLDGNDAGVTRDSFAIAFDIANLGAGEHIDSVRVVSSGARNSPQYIEVTCSITPIPPAPADLVAEPSRLTFTAASLYEVVPPKALEISCADSSNKSYSVEETADWISLSGSGGVTPDTIEVTIDMSSLTTGSWVDTIRVMSDEMSNSPIDVVCSLFTPVWQVQLHSAQNHVLQDIVFADQNTGWAVGYASDPITGRAGYLYETFDGGDTWDQRLLLSSQTFALNAFVGVENIDSDAWAIAEHGVLYRTSDGGDTWESSTIDLPSAESLLKDIKFVTAEVGWIIGSDGLILKTSDGGDNWAPQDSNTDEELLALSFVDENHGWIIGLHAVLLYTTDGGDTWVETTAPLINCRDIFFVNANTGWIANSDGSIWRTDNCGASWTSQESGVDVWLQSIYFVNDLEGWVAGENGTVLHTVDGGETWQTQNSGSSAWLQSVFFLDEMRGWVAGDYGEIRFTTSGGQ